MVPQRVMHRTGKKQRENTTLEIFMETDKNNEFIHIVDDYTTECDDNVGTK